MSFLIHFFLKITLFQKKIEKKELEKKFGELSMIELDLVTCYTGSRKR